MRIPDDIQKTAWKLVCGCGCITDVCSLPGCGCFESIAAALIAERERAAKIAENYRTDWAPDADNIAEAIRAPAPPSPSQQGTQT